MQFVPLPLLIVLSSSGLCFGRIVRFHSMLIFYWTYCKLWCSTLFAMIVVPTFLFLAAISICMSSTFVFTMFESVLFGMASLAKSNQVVWFVSSTFALRNDMMNFKMFIVTAFLASKVIAQKNLASNL